MESTAVEYVIMQTFCQSNKLLFKERGFHVYNRKSVIAKDSK